MGFLVLGFRSRALITMPLFVEGDTAGISVTAPIREEHVSNLTPHEGKSVLQTQVVDAL